MLSSKLLQSVIDNNKNNYSDIFKLKTKDNLKSRICCKKHCEYCALIK